MRLRASKEYTLQIWFTVVTRLRVAQGTNIIKYSPEVLWVIGDNVLNYCRLQIYNDFCVRIIVKKKVFGSNHCQKFVINLRYVLNTYARIL